MAVVGGRTKKPDMQAHRLPQSSRARLERLGDSELDEVRNEGRLHQALLISILRSQPQS